MTKPKTKRPKVLTSSKIPVVNIDNMTPVWCVFGIKSTFLGLWKIEGVDESIKVAKFNFNNKITDKYVRLKGTDLWTDVKSLVDDRKEIQRRIDNYNVVLEEIGCSTVNAINIKPIRIRK